MRIIAGSAKGRRLKTTAGPSVRPTADKVRGAIFNILGSRFDIEGATVLDLFAGSGALGIEALSRGAAHVTFVEQVASVARLIQQNLQLCGFEPRARVLCQPVTRALKALGREGAQFDGVLLDPPYGKGLVGPALGLLGESSLLRSDAWIVIEHHLDEPIVPPAPLQLTHTRHYGKTALALLTKDGMATQKAEKSAHTRAVYAGSFDPITNGHLDVIRRALQVFDEVIVAVADTSSDAGKSGFFFSAPERVEMIREVLNEIGDGRATADSFTGLLVDYCEQVGARVSIRGLRAVSDFEYEFQMAMMNRHLKPKVETVFMAAGQAHFYTSSRLVKEVARLNGDVRGLLPDAVLQRLLKKLGKA